MPPMNMGTEVAFLQPDLTIASDRCVLSAIIDD
jgi:hypothetical protein